METETNTATKPKKREWIKNAAIIFLAALLILTFFSNTILNSSLPEVATREIGSGTITARIRVTGTVSANQNYEVSVDESRRVRSVMVKQGQEVSSGDVLFVLSDGESEELESAEDTLRELNRSYQEKLIGASEKDYAKENREIQQARADLADAERERDALAFDPLPLQQARENLDQQQVYVDAAQAVADRNKAAVDAAKADVEQARLAVDPLKTRVNNYQAEVNRYTRELADAQYGRDQSSDASGERSTPTQDLRTALNLATQERNDAQSELNRVMNSSAYKSLIANAKAAGKTTESYANSLNDALNDYNSQISDLETQKNEITSKLSESKAKWTDLDTKIAQYNQRITEATPDDWILINKLKADKAILESELVQLKAEIRTIAEEVQENIETLTDIEAIEAIEKKIQDNFQEKIDSLVEPDGYDEYQAYQEYVKAKDAADEAELAWATAKAAYDAANNDGTYLPAQDYDGHNHAWWEKECQRLEKLKRAAEEDLENAQNAQSRAEDNVTRMQDALSAAQEKLAEAQDTLADAKSKYSDAESKLSAEEDRQDAFQDKVEAAEDKVKQAEKALGDLLVDLQSQQRSDNKQAQLEALELQDMAAQIERQRKKVEELRSGSAEKEVKAPVSGVIQSVDITAGQTTMPKSPMATIELPDMGYALTASVSNDQARRVHTGDTATVANMYWGTEINATLTGIKPDPRDPQNQKQLSFELTGDVSPGSSLTLSVGERSAEYDFVVPNSAMRNDSNGDFILVVAAKASPLGTRYTATRVNVTKLASDDTATAISGALNMGDFVITTSTAPIKNGDRVRLADTQTGG